MLKIIFRNLKKIKIKNSNAETFYRNNDEILKLENELKLADAAGDTARKYLIRERICKLLKESDQIAKESGFIGKGEVGAKASQYMQIRYKEASSFLKKWGDGLKKSMDNPKTKEFIDNVESSKSLKPSIIPKNNPFV